MQKHDKESISTVIISASKYFKIGEVEMTVTVTSIVSPSPPYKHQPMNSKGEGSIGILQERCSSTGHVCGFCITRLAISQRQKSIMERTWIEIKRVWVWGWRKLTLLEWAYSLVGVSRNQGEELVSSRIICFWTELNWALHSKQIVQFHGLTNRPPGPKSWIYSWTKTH